MMDAEKIIKEADSITEKEAAREISKGEVFKIGPENIYLLRLKEFPGVVVVGEHVTTGSESLRGVYVGNVFGTHDEQSLSAMALAGWESAGHDKRFRLALLWAEKVMFQFAGIFVKEESYEFVRSGSPAWKKPRGAVLDDGAVKVTFWYREIERGRSAVKIFNRTEVIFNSDGSFRSTKILETFDASDR